MKGNPLFTRIILLMLPVILTACSPTRRLNEGEYLLVKNEISTNRKELPQSEIKQLVKPSANHKMLGIYPMRATIYQSMLPKEGKKDRKWKQWFRKNFGEEPVLLDSASIEYSCQQIQLYLYNNGYFESEVRNGIQTHRKKAKVKYTITAGEPYTMNELHYQISDTAVMRLIGADRENSLLKTGMRYNTELFKNERNRIANMLANEGYYLFRPEHITYRVDSNLNRRRFNLTLCIDNRKGTEAQQLDPLRKYHIQNVLIRYSSTEDSSLLRDTYTEQERRKQAHTYTILHPKTLYYKPKVITYPLDFHTGSLYSADAAKSSYNRYNDMQLFRHIRISYAVTEESRNHPEADTGWLRCHIQLTPWEKHKLNLELLGKDIGSDYGVGVNLNLKNRNLLHLGEIQYYNLLFSTEFERSTTQGEGNEEIPMWRYRNFELGGEIGFNFPKMILPFSQSLLPKKYRAQTRISAGGYFQQRDHYSRFIANIGTEYEWRPAERTSHILKLLDINTVKIFKDSVFDLNLARYSQRIVEKYTSHVLVGTNYKFLYNNLKSNKRQNFFRLRVNLNSYGNLLYGLFSLSPAEKNSKGQYTIAGTPFTSFVSGEIDFSYNQMLWERSSIVLHTSAGLGIPTSNASTLPFERSFYLGGTNSMRAWNLRSLGPGSYHGTLSNFESSGDMKLEWNVEFRTPLYKKLHTALFFDMGNIWNLRNNPEIPNGEFDWNRFYKEFALDGGIGLRLDISFVVIRMDVATALYTPYLPEGERWVKNPVALKKLNFRFGIGYPF